MAKDLKAVREVFTNIRTQLASAATAFEGPLKVLFDEVTGKLGGLLDGLAEPRPGTNDAAAHVSISEPVVATLASATGLINLLTQENAKLRTGMSALQTTASATSNLDTLAAAVAAGTHLSKADHEAAVTKAVEAAIASRTGAQGDLVPKATVDQLCSAAKDLGIKEGREAATKEAATAVAAEKLATERTTALTTAGLPLPEDDSHSATGRNGLRVGQDHVGDAHQDLHGSGPGPAGGIAGPVLGARGGLQEIPEDGDEHSRAQGPCRTGHCRTFRDAAGWRPSDPERADARITKAKAEN